jgi:hypothetical protein
MQRDIAVCLPKLEKESQQRIIRRLSVSISGAQQPASHANLSGLAALEVDLKNLNCTFSA